MNVACNEEKHPETRDKDGKGRYIFKRRSKEAVKE